MLICHLSDTHGSHFWKYADLKNIDMVVHTGDLLPNFTRQDLHLERALQKAWLIKHFADFSAWLGEKPFIYCQGNHDYVELNSVYGHLVIRVGLKPIEILGKKFIGYPEIPEINGTWNHETSARELHMLASEVTDSDAEILLTHTPPAGIFAKIWGCPALTSCLMNKQHQIKAHLFGHVHMEQYSQAIFNEIVFSNAAIDDDKVVFGGIVEV